MLTLFQLIARMQFFGYEIDEIVGAFEGIRCGEIEIEEIFDVLGLELPTQPVMDRFEAVLNHEAKYESAMKVALLQAEAAA